MSDGSSVPTNQVVHQMREGLRAAQRLQAQYDAVGWRIQEPSWAKARHMLYHLLNAIAELAQFVESAEHAEQEGRGPTSDDFRMTLAERPRLAADLVFHAAQIANLQAIDLGEQLVDLWRLNATKFAPDSEFARLS